jgi:hypothetical protein
MLEAGVYVATTWRKKYLEKETEINKRQEE